MKDKEKKHYQVEYKTTAPCLIQLESDERAIQYALDNRGKGLLKLFLMKIDNKGVIRKDKLIKDWN